jgi:hypothetical protein
MKTRYSPGMPVIAKGAPLAKTTTLNSILESAEEFERRKLGDQGAGRRSIPNVCQAKVKNNSGANRRRGELLEFNDFALDDDEAENGSLWFIGGNPAMANGFGVLVRATPDNEIDDCQVLGVCFALVNMVSASHKFASPKKDNYVLQSCPAGPVRILNSPGGTGEKKCAVLLTSDATGLVKPVSDIAQGGSGNCKIWLNGADTGATINLLAVIGDCDGGTLCTQWGGYVFPGECGE